MASTETYRGRGGAITVKSTIDKLGSKLSVLHTDTNSVLPMPRILTREKGVRNFVDSLEQRGFTELAIAFGVTHEGKKRVHGGKQFQGTKERKEYEHYASVINDLGRAVEENAPLLDSSSDAYREWWIATLFKTPDKQIPAKVQSLISPDDMKNGSLLLTFYELYLRSHNTDDANFRLARQRAAFLASESGFMLSPLMERTLAIQTKTSQQPKPDKSESVIYPMKTNSTQAFKEHRVTRVIEDVITGLVLAIPISGVVGLTSTGSVSQLPGDMYYPYIGGAIGASISPPPEETIFKATSVHEGIINAVKAALRTGVAVAASGGLSYAQSGGSLRDAGLSAGSALAGRIAKYYVRRCEESVTKND